jgi:hypothetical protein
MVMIVVPSLAECDQGDKPVVSAVVFSRETPASEYVSERIHRESAVIKEHCANEESPHQHLPTRCTQAWRKSLQH